ncbi:MULTISPECIES: aminoacyl-tRNA hydrolase [Arcobacter]|jgi:PTH1 family peptidyl-tRNA hydrolase|uniref:Peptidyl-tRNA hydrolase n=1 Tax=Arcobacter ellisii TaxID=913109 RepID=A0A347U6M1_9BACT|nr:MULTISPECIES: aminoacyl-tRNA hydrolase [Arcobacter]AXX94499.1 peptidyl-tRNA hydrolase [Arcobacter ellisii]MBD3829047.1 aminoacyl-tRNA hydrolase [Arcobacter sp.]MDY3203717.1 aminoacyl-tRNA hydrolase [Arcobacter sp.]RXI31197.1 aminoacyl-tRNA hydrolase [Arcobacter ellisii]
MYLIVGLGNIGEKYQLTRHNIGFLVIDEMTKNLSTSNVNNTNFQSTLLKSGYNLFAKPTTYMNNSGVAVHAIKEYYKIDLENIIVIHDDLDLPFGTVKFKIGGGHGGHNGLRSLDSHIGKDYIRVRIGIGKPADKGDVANYVLSNFSKEELNKLQDIIPHTIKAIEALKTEEIDLVKSKFSLK